MAYCYTCKGTGLQDENNVCPECNGFGSIQDEVITPSTEEVSSEEIQEETAVEAPETPEASESFSPSDVEPEAPIVVDEVESEVIEDAASEGAEVPEINQPLE